jgi:transposase-like protein
MITTTPNAPTCPNCTRLMELARVTPRLGGLPELQTFICRPCGVALTEAVESNVARPDTRPDTWRDTPPVER